MKKIGLSFLFVLVLQAKVCGDESSGKATYYYNEQTKSFDAAQSYSGTIYDDPVQSYDEINYDAEDNSYGEGNCDEAAQSDGTTTPYWEVYEIKPYELCGIDFCSLFDSTIVEARVSYFGFFSKRLRQIYNNGGANYTVSAMVPICGGFNVWGAIDYFSKRGKYGYLDASTRITIAPLTLGVKYVYSFNSCLDLYGGIGMRYFFMRVRNSNSSFLSRHVNRSGLGGVVEVGAIYKVTDCWLAEVFGNASAKRLKGNRHAFRSDHTQVGGWSIGAGIGYRF